VAVLAASELLFSRHQIKVAWMLSGDEMPIQSLT
jgi:hypothetical protein